jgi:DNA end-binding protein Ku
VATTVWKGQLTFGLVSIPIRLFKAARAEKISFRQLYRQPSSAPRQDEEEEEEQARPRLVSRSGAAAAPAEAPDEETVVPVQPVEQRVFTASDGTPVSRADLVKGYEYERQRYVVIDPEEIRALTPQTSPDMEVVEFVKFEEIDPVHLESSYYVRPDRAGERGYALLYQALRNTGYAGLARVAMHKREHIMILRPGRQGLIGHTMFYADEVRGEQEFQADLELVGKRELELASMFVQSLAATFDPAKFKDTYRQRVQALIEGKLASRQVAEAPRKPAASAQVLDITKALEQSLAAIKKAAPGRSKPPATKRVRKTG